MRKLKRQYDLDEIKGLVMKGGFRTSKRVATTLRNHGYLDVSEVVRGVFSSIEQAHFYKSDELRNIPGVFADIYKGVPWDDVEWYVKFFQQSDGATCVDIWSLKEDGWM